MHRAEPWVADYTPLAKQAKTVYKYRYGGPMTEELTPKQQKILNFVRKAIQKTGFPPTRIEISNAFRYSSPNAAEEHLRMLERKGAIELTPGASRGIRLTEEPGLPLIGRVAAGSPILAEEHIERRCQVDPALFEPRSGQIAVARLHDEVTVKRLRRRGNTVELLPENPEFKTLVVDLREDDFAIEGLGVGVIRRPL